MQKTPELFDGWNEKKKEIECTYRNIIVKKGEIRNCTIGVNVGSELSKDGVFVRPVIILKTGLGGDLVLAAPLTTKYRQEYARNYVMISDYAQVGLRKPSWVLLNQIKPMSIKRLTRKLNNITVGEYMIPTVHGDVVYDILIKYYKLFLP